MSLRGAKRRSNLIAGERPKLRLLRCARNDKSGTVCRLRIREELPPFDLPGEILYNRVTILLGAPLLLPDMDEQTA